MQFAVNSTFTIRLTNTKGGPVKQGEIALMIKNTKLPNQPVLTCEKHKLNKKSKFESVLYSGAKDMLHINLNEHFGLLWKVNENQDTHNNFYESYLKFTCHTSDQSFKRGTNNMWVFNIENIKGFVGDVFSTDFKRFKVMRSIRDESSIKKSSQVSASKVPSLLSNTDYENTFNALLQEQKEKIQMQSVMHREAEEVLLDRSLRTLANELFMLGVISATEKDND